jgi:hypothetical protein
MGLLRQSHIDNGLVAVGDQARSGDGSTHPRSHIVAYRAATPRYVGRDLLDDFGARNTMNVMARQMRVMAQEAVICGIHEHLAGRQGRTFRNVKVNLGVDYAQEDVGIIRTNKYNELLFLPLWEVHGEMQHSPRIETVASKRRTELTREEISKGHLSRSVIGGDSLGVRQVANDVR